MMSGAEVIVGVSAGINVLTLSAIILNSYRIGKIEGALRNGDYLRCPFYRSKVSNRVRQQNGKNDCKK